MCSPWPTGWRPTSRARPRCAWSGWSRRPDTVRDGLAEIGVDPASVEGRDLYYFAFEATLLEENSPGGLDGFAPYDFADGGPWTRDNDVSSTLVFEDLPGCPEEEFETGADETDPVTKIAFCSWRLIGEDDELYGLQYAPLFVDTYEPINGDPVVWSTSATPEESHVVEG